MKFCVWHHSFKPNITIDPELTLTLPRNLTAWTGFDALTHAIEAFLVPSFNPLCDAMALEALKLVLNFYLLFMMSQTIYLLARECS